MNTKSPITINLNVDWRVLIILVLIASILFVVYSAATAQSTPPSTNDASLEPVQNLPEPAPVVPPVPPEQQDGDLVPTTNGEWIPRDSLGVTTSSLPQPAEAVTSGAGGRRVYLTHANYATNQVLTACASGYHMASMWEIYDISNLIYNYTHSAAEKKSDSGYGPPSYWNGWVRTGNDSSTSSTTGTGNCSNWSSTSASAYGVSVRLSRTWETAPGDLGPWDATSFSCSLIGPVWCMEN